MDIQPSPYVNATATAPPPPAGTGGTLGAIADRLGMTAPALQSALADGQSLAGLAEQQGVPRATLASFIQAQISQAREASGQPALDQTALERMVERALERGRRPPEAEAQATGEDSSDPAALVAGTYTSNARTAAISVRTPGTISLLA